jgi:hypothetical protein
MVLEIKMFEAGLDNIMWFMGVVENNDDPTHHGRIQVRVFGIHPPIDTNQVITADLPWAFMVNGTGGRLFAVPDIGDWVVGFFADGRDAQHPFVIGVVHGSHMGFPQGSGGAAGFEDRAGEGTSTPSGPVNVPPLSGTTEERAKQAIDYFVSQGWTREQAAGIVANLIKESNLDPSAYYKTGAEESFGLAQWNSVGSPERVANAQRVMGVSDIREATFEQQLAFVQWELTNTETRAASALSSQTTAAGSATTFDRLYERSDGSTTTQRANLAESLL